MSAGYSDQLAIRSGETGSNLCVGLDPRIEKHGDNILEVERFLDHVIDQTLPSTACYKPNIAYFEAMGPEGLMMLKRVLERIPENVPVILDAKRSDIGETQRRYAEACFEGFRADAVTINPFMGYDSIEPFLVTMGRVSIFWRSPLIRGARIYSAGRARAAGFLRSWVNSPV